MPVTEPIKFSFDAPTWSLGKSMAAHISIGRNGEVYHNDLKDTIYQTCGRRDDQWEMISTRKDRSIAAFIQESTIYGLNAMNKCFATKAAPKTHSIAERRQKIITISMCLSRRENLN